MKTILAKNDIISFLWDDFMWHLRMDLGISKSKIPDSKFSSWCNWAYIPGRRIEKIWQVKKQDWDKFMLILKNNSKRSNKDFIWFVEQDLNKFLRERE